MRGGPERVIYGYLQRDASKYWLSTVIYARNGASRLEALAPRALPTMAELTGEAAAVPAAVPAVLETATETTPAPPARRCSGLPHGVKAVKKSGKYQGNGVRVGIISPGL